MKLISRHIPWLYTLLVVPLFAIAQTAEDAGALLENQKNMELPALVPSTLPIVPRVDKSVPQSYSTKETIVVTSIDIQGVKAFSLEAISGLVQGYYGKSLQFKDLQEACQVITAYYRKHGYFLAKAYLPKQGFENGKVVIQVQEGALELNEGVQVRGSNLRIDPNTLRDMVTEEVGSGSAINMKKLEAAVLNMNDLPGIRASANLEASNTPGATRVVINASEGPVFNSMLGFDNSGSRLTSARRVTGAVRVNDPFGWGDQLAASFNTSYYTNNNYYRVGYQLPIGAKGLKTGLAYNGLNYVVGKELSALSAKGNAGQWAATARYPLLRTRAQSLFVNAELDYKSLYDKALNITTNDKRLMEANLGLAAEMSDTLGGGGFSTASLTWTQGRLNLKRVPSAFTADQAITGPRTQGAFGKLNYSVARLQHATPMLTFMGSLSGQFAFKNLDSSEKIQFGGPFGVRAYPVGEANADEGHKLTLEARSTLLSGASYGMLQVYGFYDNAWVRLAHEPRAGAGTTNNTYAISGAGLGVALYKQTAFDVKGVWASKLKKNPARNLTNGQDSDGSKDMNRFWLTANIYF